MQTPQQKSVASASLKSQSSSTHLFSAIVMKEPSELQQQVVPFLSATQRDGTSAGLSVGGKTAESQLMESTIHLASIINSAMDAIITIDASQKIVLFNESAEKMFGYPAAEALGQPLEKFIPARFRHSHGEHVANFGSTNQTKRSMGMLGTIFGLRANGEEFPIEASISHTTAENNRFYTVIIRDITLRAKTEEQLKEKAALLDHAQDAILVRDLADRVLFWNKSAERLYGWSAEEVLGKSVSKLIYKDYLLHFEKAKQAVLTKGEWVGELQQVTREGKELTAECRWALVRDDAGNPESILVINTDITDRKKLEAQFLRAQRMESIGTLAGGIAHDLNNLLSPILMAVQLLQRKVTDEDGQRLLKTLKINAERGGELIKHVLSFARGVEGERIGLQPKHLIREIVKMLKDTLPKSIEVSFLLPESSELWSIKGDATQIHQVIMNLCVNARDAMPEGGRLKITLENRTFDENYARMHLEAKPGRYVLIIVEDTGIGIPANIVDRIFEPFFTTKEHGKGTGLGLSTVTGIVKSHGGFIDVYSEIGRGTTFRLCFPAIETSGAKSPVEENPDLPVGHGELILVVDDEESIREITKSTLQAFGYSVMTASDGTEALALYVQNKDEIKVVLTDMMMPYMDGPSTIRALRKMNPNVKVIASSGLTDNGKSFETADLGVKTFLSKPYTAEKLLKALAEILK
jgi:PAS domain S-box-containing protein